MKCKSIASEPAQAGTSAQPDIRGSPSSSTRGPPTKRRILDPGATVDFQYRPLRKHQIRLLRYISKGPVHSSHLTTEEHLNFEIHHVSLAKPPEYLALSYAWGKPKFLKTIFCNGKMLLITRNLDRALRAVFYAIQKASSDIWTQGEDVYVWADGICINQQDIQEKDVQVPQMGAIFSRARGAIGYIGAPKTGTAGAGFDAVAVWGRMERCPLTGEYSESQTQQEMSDTKLQDLKEFWSSEWFIRTWVTQEMVLSANVAFIYGAVSDIQTWPFWLLEKCCSRVNIDPSQGPHQVGAWAQAKRLGYDRQVDPIWKSLGVLIDTRTTHASDVRDKIYAILALFSPEDREAIEVDYSATNLVQHVYVRVAEHFVATPGAFLLLEQAGTSRKLPEIPSWVPDWSFLPRHPLPLWLYCCVASRKAQVIVQSTARRLVVSGVIIDSVMTLGNLIRHPESSLDHEWDVFTQMLFKTASQLFKQCWGSAGTYPNGEDAISVICRTLVYNSIFRGGRSERISPNSTEYLDLVMALRTHHNSLSSGDKVSDVEGTTESWIKDIRHVMGPFWPVSNFYFRRIIGATTHGLLGVLPDDTRIGDIVTVLFGGNVPFVLRPAGDGEFELVGPCYIHGIMDGELMDEDNPMRKAFDFKEQDFIIK